MFYEIVVMSSGMMPVHCSSTLGKVAVLATCFLTVVDSSHKISDSFLNTPQKVLELVDTCSVFINYVRVCFELFSCCLSRRVGFI